MKAFEYLSLIDRLVQFIDSYDPPLKGLQEDLNFVSPRIGEVKYLLYLMHKSYFVKRNIIYINILNTEVQVMVLLH